VLVHVLHQHCVAREVDIATVGLQAQSSLSRQSGNGNPPGRQHNEEAEFVQKVEVYTGKRLKCGDQSSSVCLCGFLSVDLSVYLSFFIFASMFPSF
jgi:hypothetical protein